MIMSPPSGAAQLFSTYTVFFMLLYFMLSISERADPNYCRDRITEGANINKSLVTLGIVISALGIGKFEHSSQYISLYYYLDFFFNPVFSLSSLSSELSNVQ